MLTVRDIVTQLQQQLDDGIVEPYVTVDGGVKVPVTMIKGIVQDSDVCILVTDDPTLRQTVGMGRN